MNFGMRTPPHPYPPPRGGRGGEGVPNSEPPVCQRTCSAGRRTPNCKGFTLVELIMVLVIIAILAAVVIPRVGFDVPSRGSLEGAAHMIASDIRYAQEWAMANRTSKTITFPGGNSYSFSPPNSLDPSGKLPSGVTTTAFTFAFNSLGEPTTGGGGSVTVSLSGGSPSKTINVANYTGKVSIL
jgi:prepilin-type N-terminal cleavage/methylation domain-containing protein